MLLFMWNNIIRCNDAAKFSHGHSRQAIGPDQTLVTVAAVRKSAAIITGELAVVDWVSMRNHHLW